jgi:hypothetical protein
LGSSRQRRAIAPSQKGQVTVPAIKSAAPVPAPAREDEDEVAKVDSGDLSGGGKLNPAQGLPGGSGLVVLLPEDEDKKAKPKVDETYTTKMWVPIIKATKERRTITGVVLEPDTVDAHGDTIPALVILDAAEDFLADINVETTLGVQHKDFKAPLELVQSFVVSDSDIMINNVLVLKGSWVITVRVNSAKIWKQIKDGKLTGFSIGGKATVQNLQPQAVA